MKHFQPNTELYDKLVTSYTATDEFDLNTRVHITNEKPPFDLSDALHSTLRDNQMWREFVGYSWVNPGLTYNIDTDGVEVIKNDEVVEASTAKYVNGSRAMNYGPLPQYAVTKTLDSNGKYRYDYELQSTEEGFRIDENGLLMPEYDLLLHEVYRYLQNLYPNHPDWRKLLTAEEFDDEIDAAATIIDHTIDTDTYKWLAGTLLDDDEAIEQETAMMMIRDLTNHAYIEKWAGSRKYYEMLGSLIYQHVHAYPVFKYVPLESITETEKDYNVNYEWLKSLQAQPEDFENRDVNYNNRMFGRRIRMIDTDASTYNYENRYQDVIAFYGTAYATPKSKYILYEYKLANVIDDTDEVLSDLSYTMADDFSAGDRIKMNGQNNEWETYDVAHIAAVRTEKRYIPSLYVKSSKSNLTLNTADLPVIDIDSPGKVNSIKSYIYTEDNDDLYEKVTEGKTEDEIKEIDSSLKGKTYSEQRAILLDNAEDPVELFVSPDPHQNGCLYCAPKSQLAFYGEWLDLNLNWPSSTDAAASRGDILTIKAESINPDADGGSFHSVITGTSDGYVDFEITSSALSSLKAFNTIAKNNTKIGLELQNDDGNKVVLFGVPTYGSAVQSNNDKYAASSIHLDIKAVPKELTDASLLAFLHSSYTSYAEKYYDDLGIVCSEDDTYTQCKDKIDAISDAYSGFTKPFNEMLSTTVIAHPNSVVWQNVKVAAKAFRACLKNEVMLKEFDEAYEVLLTYDVVAYDTGTLMETPLKVFKSVCYNLFNDYAAHYKNDLLLTECSYPEITTENTLAQQNAASEIVSIRKAVNAWLKNRENIYTDDLYNFKTGLTSLTKLFAISVNKYGETFDYTALNEMGTKGDLTDWDMGSISTSSLNSQKWNRTSGEYEWSDLTTVSTCNIVQLLKSGGVWSVSDKFLNATDTDTSRKFSYADPNWLDNFLKPHSSGDGDISSSWKNNIRGEINDKYSVPVTVNLEKSSTTITFNTLDAISKLDFISTGDQVSGKYIPDDTYVESINTEDHYVVVTNPMVITAEQEIKFTGRTQFYAADETDLFDYRVQLSKNNLAFSYSIVDGGDCLPPMSIRTWLADLTEELQTNTTFTHVFNRISKLCGNSRPAMILTIPDFYVEVSPMRVFSTDGEEFIMNQRLLNWLKDNSSNRASSNVGFGTNITVDIVVGDRLTGNNYTDGDIHLRCITTDKWDTSNSNPYYIKIGTGAQPATFFHETSVDESDEEYENDASYYNDETDPYGTAIYTGESSTSNVISSNVKKDLVEPVLKLPLTEYEVNRHVTLSDDNVYTLLNFSVAKQKISSDVTGFSQLMDHNRDNNEMVSSLPLAISENKSYIDGAKTGAVYLGTCTNWPTDTYESTDYMYYYKVGEQVVVDNETWYKDDLIIYDGSKWVHAQWNYSGVIGDTTAIAAANDLGLNQDFNYAASVSTSSTSTNQLQDILLCKALGKYSETPLKDFLELGDDLYMCSIIGDDNFSDGDFVVAWHNFVLLVNKTVTLALATN